MKSVLFVCLGNICRSPAAESIFEGLLNKESLGEEIKIDSAGTSAYHEGSLADSRMIEHAKARGYNITSISRRFMGEKDFNEFDLIIVMDDQNLRDVLSQDIAGIYKSKVKKMTDFCKVHSVDEVPDPYVGGAEGFNWVLDILEDACAELLVEIKKS